LSEASKQKSREVPRQIDVVQAKQTQAKSRGKNRSCQTQADRGIGFDADRNVKIQTITFVLALS
jgi:hypothetical protein